MKRSKCNIAADFMRGTCDCRETVIVGRKGDMKPDFIVLCDRVDERGVPTDFILESERDYQALHRHFYRRGRRLIRVALSDGLWVARELRSESDRFPKGLRMNFTAALGRLGLL